MNYWKKKKITSYKEYSENVEEIGVKGDIYKLWIYIKKIIQFPILDN